jgi:hypothetical protein
VASDAAANPLIAAGKSVSPTSEDLVAEIADDGMSFRLRLDDVREATSIRVVPRDADGISAQAAYRYFIGVVRDEPPETSMRLSGIGSAITPIALLPISASATDDYGIEAMSITMTLRTPVEPKADAEAVGELTEQIHSVQPKLDREGRAELSIDLRELVDQDVLQEVAPGATVMIGTTAQDRFNLATPHVTQGELVRLQIVTPEALLATLERRELEFRSRLEQAIDETRRLRQSLTAIETEATEVLSSPAVSEDELPVAELSEGGDSGANEPTSEAERDLFRARQRVQLRIRQAELQAAKTTEELAGIVAGLDDLLLEMVNNRIDSVDRRERLEAGVRTPLANVVEEPFPNLRRQIVDLERILMTVEPKPAADTDGAPSVKMEQAVRSAVATNDEILLQLSAVLEKMLDLESFNEILDLMRGLIQDQEGLLEETEEEQKKRVLDLFK